MFGFFLGGIIGALTIFFLGTKEGKKTGKILEEKGRDVLDAASDKVEDLRKKGVEIIEEGNEVKEKFIEELKEKKNEIADQAVEKLDDTLAKIETIQEEGLQKTTELRKRLFKNLPPRRK